MDTKDNDRELLEWAAKAAGLDVHWGKDWQLDTMFRSLPRPNSPLVSNVEWNPLRDDDDALRLAVKLRLNITHHARSTGVMCVQAVIDWGLCKDAFHEDHGADPGAATRRAIVRAAAEIGRSMT